MYLRDFLISWSWVLQGKSPLIPVPAVFPESLTVADRQQEKVWIPQPVPPGVLTPRAELQGAESLSEVGGPPQPGQWMQIWIRALIKHAFD